jgi:hypothetical protein
MKSYERWRARWQAFRRPIDPEKQAILNARWRALPAELQTANQISGRHLTHCGFTLGASYCSFHCTHCYLPKNANQVPIPSLAEMKAQIDANRGFQGPGGGLQITGGDVADAYWRARRPHELVEIIQYARRVGLVPMLMTHGQTLVANPEFLEQLVIEGGLRQISVHVDTTQAGRAGYPIQRIRSESDLDPVRESFTNLAADIRRRTGACLELALSFTVTRRNLDDVPGVIQWYLANPDRTRIWRMLSFQPEANTGRTIFSAEPITPALVWERICEGTGLRLRRDASIFGHPDCNSWASLLVSQRSGEYLPLLPDEKKWDELFGEILARIGGLSLVADDAGTAPFRLLGVLAQNPLLAIRLVAHLGAHAVRSGLTGSMLSDIATGKVHTLGIGMHNFMDAATVARADEDACVRARLDACVFKGAVRENGGWVAVPMCKMNEAKWSEVYAERLANGAGASRREPLPEPSLS